MRPMGLQGMNCMNVRYAHVLDRYPDQHLHAKADEKMIYKGCEYLHESDSGCWLVETADRVMI